MWRARLDRPEIIIRTFTLSFGKEVIVCHSCRKKVRFPPWKLRRLYQMYSLWLNSNFGLFLQTKVFYGQKWRFLSPSMHYYTPCKMLTKVWHLEKKACKAHNQVVFRQSSRTKRRRRRSGWNAFPIRESQESLLRWTSNSSNPLENLQDRCRTEFRDADVNVYLTLEALLS